MTDPAIRAEAAHLSRREGDPLFRLADAMVEDILAMSDDEIAAELAAAGFDPAAEAERVRRLVRQAALDAAADRAGRRAEAAMQRATTP